MLFERYPDIVSVNDIMKMLKIGKSSAYTLLKNNEIRHVRVGKKYIIPKDAVVGFVENMCYNKEQIIDGRLGLSVIHERSVNK